MGFKIWAIGKFICPRLKYRASKENGCFYQFKERKVTIGADAWEDEVGFSRHIITHHEFPFARNYSMGLWSLLHEIGHYKTEDYAEDDVDTRIMCALIPFQQAQASVAIQNLYYDIPCEYEATEWAISWISTHPRLAEFFSNLLNKKEER